MKELFLITIYCRAQVRHFSLFANLGFLRVCEACSQARVLHFSPFMGFRCLRLVPRTIRSAATSVCEVVLGRFSVESEFCPTFCFMTHAHLSPGPWEVEAVHMV